MILTVMWLMTALVIGFMVGRISMYGSWDTDEEGIETEKGEASAEVRSRKRRHGPEDKGQFWSVGSPLSGEVIFQEEGDRPTVVIHPDEGRLYAPADGRITRLFPMGNSFLFTTDFGAELYIQAGAVGDELLSGYYRPRVSFSWNSTGKDWRRRAYPQRYLSVWNIAFSAVRSEWLPGNMWPPGRRFCR